MSDRPKRLPPAPVEKYGLTWKPSEFRTPLDIEYYFIRRGGTAQLEGKTYGLGMFHHVREAMTLLWPEDDHHRWSDLILKTVCEERITVVMGPRDCGKTHTLSKWALIDYWINPQETLTIMTSTGIRELGQRLWGDIKSLFEAARNRYPELPGNSNDSKMGIFTDSLEERGSLRDTRRGLVCIPMLTGDGEWVGLDRFVGIKQKRRRLIADELQFLPVNYVNVLDAIDKGDFKGGFLGNPIGGNGKALDKISEPVGGWASLGEVTKTTTWRNKYQGVTVNLVGTDSPNFDKGITKKFTYLIDQDDIDKVVARNGKDSAQYWTLIMGVRKTGVDTYRVLTVDMCENYGAFNSVVWAGGQLTKIYAIDAGYGGDPCEAMYAEFGEDVTGRQILNFSQTKTIPVEVSKKLSPEDQIALYAKSDCANLGVPDENVYFDAGMRATLAISMARVMSPAVNAINFGGPATDRPVDDETFTEDAKTREKRLVKCNEQYSKFVTELWYSVRQVVEAKQAKGMPKDVAEEFALREWRWVPGPIGPRYELETKPEFKARMGGQSPNKADVASIACEGARRLGFKVSNPKEFRSVKAEEQDVLEQELAKYQRFVKKSELKYS